MVLADLLTVSFLESSTLLSWIVEHVHSANWLADTPHLCVYFSSGGNYGAGYGAGYGGGGMNVISSVMGALNGLMGQLSPVFAQDQYIDGVSAPIAPSYGQSITLG